MKRPRKFLIFILILLVINTIFFVAWYALDLQGTVKELVEREAGKALKGRLRISSFTISDQQVYAEGISFTATDKSLNFKVSNARIRFNLLKFIFSGFKIRNILHHVEINKADISYNYIHTPKPKKPKKPFELPDLRPFFNTIKLTDSSVKFNMEYPLDLGGLGILSVSEELSAVNLTAVNTSVSNIRFSAISSSKGTIAATAILDDGQLVSSHAEINNFIPQHISHPQIQDTGSELNLVLDASQDKKNSPLILDGKAILWDTRALLFSIYPVRIPYLTLTFADGKLEADVSQSTVGSSSLAGSIQLDLSQENMGIEPSELVLQLDLGMFDPALQGTVDATIKAEGSLKDPVVSLSASSHQIFYQAQRVHSIALDASYAEEELSFTLHNATWQNLSVRLAGAMDTKFRKMIATLDVAPVSEDFNELKVVAAADLEITLYEALPEVKAIFTRLDIDRGNIHYKDVSGHLNLFPASQGEKKNYYVELELEAADSTSISLVGDLLDRNLLLDADFQKLAIAELYPQKTLIQLAPVISGTISAFMTGDQIVASTNIDLSMNSDLDIQSGLAINGSYNLKDKQGFAILQTENASLNEQPVNLSVVSEIDGTNLKLISLQFNDQLLLSGDVNLKDFQDSRFNLSLLDISSETLATYYPQINLPEFSGLDLLVSYYPEEPEPISAELILKELIIPGLRPMQARFTVLGPPDSVHVAGKLSNQYRQLIAVEGIANLLRDMDLQATVSVSELAMSDFMDSAPAEGAINAVVDVDITDIFSPARDMTFKADIASTRISIPGIVELDDIVIKASQTTNLLTVDTLYVSVSERASIQSSGALDYNLISQSFYEGENILQLKIDGDLFAWLEDSVELVTEARGTSRFSASLKTFDDQFLILNGNLEIEDGYISLEDQNEPISDINLKAVITNNRMQMSDTSFFVGNGKVTIINEFDEDPTNHFTVAFLDLGSFKIRAEEPGIRIYLPLFTAPRTTSNLILRGQNSDWATVTGPFEDMSISAEVLVYNADAVYPPNTNNLLNLIYSFRSAFSRAEDISEPVPLPFNLDLMIRMKDNVRYTTYPAKLDIQPEGYLHIVYDGLSWHAKDAYFYSDLGSIDFFGTVFQAENLTITILESQNIMDVQGTFFRRSEDGTIITLSISTDPDTSKPIFDRLVFTLNSDNPNDLTIANVITRLRFKSGGDLADDDNNNMLRDEALNLISDNLNTSLVAPFLLPLENTLRRVLRLDDVSISAGFFQNLFTEYTGNPNQDSGLSDVARFSSSILLNNLSVSVSKYLGRKLYLDYRVTLQEATDLQNKTRITVSHDTALRLFLPHQFRLTYTFKYEPDEEDKISHEIMLFRSFRFWVF